MNRYRIELCEPGEVAPASVLVAAHNAGDALAVAVRSMHHSDNFVVRCNLYSRDTQDRLRDFDTVRGKVVHA